MNISQEQASALLNVSGWIGLFKYTHHNLNPRGDSYSDYEGHTELFGFSRLDNRDITLLEITGVIKWIGKTEWSGIKHDTLHEYLQSMTCEYDGLYNFHEQFTDDDMLTINPYTDEAYYWSNGPSKVTKTLRVHNMDGDNVTIETQTLDRISVGWDTRLLGNYGKPMLPREGLKLSGQTEWETPGNKYTYEWDFFPTDTSESDQRLNFEKAMRQFQAAANGFAFTFINVAQVRQRYIKLIRGMSEKWMQQAKTGKLTWGTAAKLANAERNSILQESRKNSVAVAKAWAESKKPEGLSFEKAIGKAMGDKYNGKPFSQLNYSEMAEVFKEVIKSSGRDNAVSKLLPLFKTGSIALPLLSASLSIVKVWMAENKVSTGLQEVVGSAGGLAGAEAAAALGVGLLPVGSLAATTVLFIVGGVAGAIAFEAALDTSHEWFGEVVQVLTGE